MRKNNLKLLILIPMACLLAITTSCDREEEEPIELPPFESTFTVLSPSTLEATPTSGTFSNVSWDGTKLRFSGSSLSTVAWVEFAELNITGVGEYEIQESPYARASLDAIYSTAVSPDFWLNQGIDSYQGGILEITEYSKHAISGAYIFVGWHFSNSLNREVGWGMYGTFDYAPKN